MRTQKAINHLTEQINRAHIYVVLDRSWLMTTADLITRYIGDNSHHYNIFVGWQDQIRQYFSDDHEKQQYFEAKKQEGVRILNECIKHIERFGVAKPTKGRIFPRFHDWQTICAILAILGSLGYFMFDLGGRMKSIEITKEQYAKEKQLDSLLNVSRVKSTQIRATKQNAQHQKQDTINPKAR